MTRATATDARDDDARDSGGRKPPAPATQSEGQPPRPPSGSTPEGADMAARFAKVLAVVLLVSLALEVGLFNVKYWETLANTETPVEMALSTDDARLVYEADVDNASVNSIAFDLDYTGNTALTVTVALSDSGNSATTYDLPEVTYYSGGRKYLMVTPYGYVKSVRISVEQPSYGTLSIGNVTLNPQIPFSFEVKRFAFVAVVLLIIWLIRPRSPLWKARRDEQPQVVRAASVGALVVALCFTLISFAGPTDDGNVAWYDSFAYNEYTELAHSFARGELYLEEEPPTWLQEMDDQSSGDERLLGEDNVYDSSQREEQSAQYHTYSKEDAAYHDGHYYVYFGVVPVILLYLPFYLVTGCDLSNGFATLFAIMVFVLMSWMLLRELATRWFRRASAAMFVVCYATVLCASEIVYSLARPQLYNEPAAFALMFSVLGLWLLARGCRAKTAGRRCALLCLGALSIACVAGCRPQLLLVGAAIPWVGYKVWRREHAGGRFCGKGESVSAQAGGHTSGKGESAAAQAGCGTPDAQAGCGMLAAQAGCGTPDAQAVAVARGGKRALYAQLAALAIPVIAVAAALMWYNFARFGSPFDFGANYNLAGNDMTLREFSVVRSVEGIVFYLLSTPHVTTAFPFFQSFYASPSYMSINMTEPIVMGVLIQCPLTFVALYYLVKDRKRPFWLPVGWLALSGVVIAVFDMNAAGMLGRYSQDFGLFFGLAGTLALLDYDARGQVAGLARTLASVLAIVMVLFTITSRLSLMDSGSIPSGPRESTAMTREIQPLIEFWR